MGLLTDILLSLREAIYASNILLGIVTTLAASLIIFVLSKVIRRLAGYVFVYKYKGSWIGRTYTDMESEKFISEEIAHIWQNRKNYIIKGRVQQINISDPAKKANKKRKIVGVWHDKKLVFITNSTQDETCLSCTYVKRIEPNFYKGKFLWLDDSNIEIMTFYLELRKIANRGRNPFDTGKKPH